MAKMSSCQETKRQNKCFLKLDLGAILGFLGNEQLKLITSIVFGPMCADNWLRLDAKSYAVRIIGC